MNEQQQGVFHGVKAWERDGSWGCGTSLDLVPKFDLTHEQALDALGAYYSFSGKTPETHTADFHAFNDARQELMAADRKRREEFMARLAANEERHRLAREESQRAAAAV